MSLLHKTIGRIPKNEVDYYRALYQAVYKEGAQVSLGGLPARSAQLFADHTALICQDRYMTYHELYYRICQLSKKLVTNGVKPRDRVIVFFENSLEFYIAYYAVAQTGAIVVPLNTFLHETELRHIMHDAQPSMIVLHSDYKELFIKATNNTLPAVVTHPDIDMDSPVPSIIEPFPVYHLSEHEMAALLYTSGTTGLPKGVMLSSMNIISNVIQGMARLRLDQSERIFGVLPLFHSFAQNTCVWGSMFSGSTVIVVPKIERRYIVAGLQYNPTIVVGVPALYGLFCLLKNALFKKVRYFASGGDALPDKIRMLFGLLYHRRICNGYGLTESSPVIAVDITDYALPTNCVGTPLQGIEVRIVDEHGVPVIPGGIGELIVKGSNVMLGYYNAPEITAHTLRDGWLYTGDLAYIDEQGAIVITGRVKDLIIHKGFNIYPQEVENIITSYPNVMRVAVVGKPDEHTGEIPIAFVQVRAYEKNIEEALKKLCLSKLATYKVPKEFIVQIDSLPLTATNKVDKKVLRKKLIDR